MSRNKHWRDKETLYELYVEKGLSTTQIADELGCGSTTVSTWMEKHNIEKRSREIAIRSRFSSRGPKLSTDGNGYELFQIRNETEESVVKHHRLLAALEYGVEEICDKDVHHKSGIPWDNRPSNLEVMDPGEHRAHHNKGRSLEEQNLTHDENGDLVKLN